MPDEVNCISTLKNAKLLANFWKRIVKKWMNPSRFSLWNSPPGRSGSYAENWNWRELDLDQENRNHRIRIQKIYLSGCESGSKTTDPAESGSCTYNIYYDHLTKIMDSNSSFTSRAWNYVTVPPDDKYKLKCYQRNGSLKSIRTMERVEVSTPVEESKQSEKRLSVAACPNQTENKSDP
uniref:Uncharacterized protein n=1 Tax=Romanomermis culicivorax TaxID=13658 RepID=A0A915I5T2_ROMCU